MFLCSQSGLRWHLPKVNFIISRVRHCAKHDIVCKAILLLLSASIAFGGSLREAGVGLGAQAGAEGRSASPVEVPLEEVPVPSEPPSESTHSEELPTGEEASRFRAAHPSPRRRSLSTPEYSVEQLYASGVRIARRTVHSQFEHRFRNGCGAPLRC
jgi:hypothetical protein